MHDYFLPEPWQTVLPNLQEKINDVIANLDNSSIIPGKHLVLRAFELAPSDVKVVIVGQDPYPNAEHACGLAFSVPKAVRKLPPTLVNIRKELASDLGIKISETGDLSAWAERGVMLLNRTLTTLPGESLAHISAGWDSVTREVLSFLAKKPVIFLLWGKRAQELSSIIPVEQQILGVHPSPLSAYRGFFGSKPFSEVNSKLVKMGLSPIDWII
jgi:uracil-DNA glycosylase